MQVQGGLLFEHVSRCQNAKSLKRLLLNKHHAISRVILKKEQKTHDSVEQHRLRPLAMRDTTYLIHPSPLTFAALDFIFSYDVSNASSYSMGLFHHLDKLKQAFSAYVLMDMMFTIQKSVPECIPKSTVTVAPNENYEEYQNRVHVPLTHKIIDCLDNIQYLNRVDALSEQFIKSVKYFFALGMVPFVKSSNVQVKHQSLPLLTLESLMHQYMNVLENEMSKLRVPTLTELKGNSLLTMHKDTFTCTTYDEVNLPLFTYREPNPVCMTPPRTWLQDILQLEYQYHFACARHKKQSIEKMSKIHVLVASTLNKTLSEAIKNAIFKEEQSPTRNPDKTIEAVKKDKDMISEAHAKAQLIRLQMEKCESLKNEDFLTTAKEQMDRLEETIKLYTKIKPYHQSKREMLPDATQNVHVSGDLVNNMAERRLVNMTPDELARYRAKKVQNDEEKQLKRQNKKLELELHRYVREAHLLRDEVTEAISSIVKLEYLLKMEKINQELHKKKLLNCQKTEQEKSRTIETQNNIIERMKRLVTDLLEQAELETVDRKRLLRMFSAPDAQKEVDSSNRSLNEFILEQDMQELVHFFISGRFLVKKSVKSQDKEFSAFDVALEDLGVRIIPFSTLATANSLDHYNSYLPHPLMHDRRTYQQTTPVTKDSASRKMSDNSDVNIIDINPKSVKETEQIRNQVKALTGIEHVPDEIFDKRYLNCQFHSGQGNIEDLLEHSLQKRWDSCFQSVLCLSSAAFTVTGQRVSPQISTETILKYVAPFVMHYVGRSSLAYRIPPLIRDVISATETYHNVSANDIWVNILKRFYANIS